MLCLALRWVNLCDTKLAVPLMNIFEPLFLVLVLVTVITLITTAVLAVRGRFARAGRILRRLGVGAAVYFVIVITVSIFNPQRVYQVGDTQCFDDWCVQVVGAQWTGTPAVARLEVTLRLSNRARRVPMGEKGTVVYLIDAQGRRVDPVPVAADVPLDVMLQPGQSISTTRTFDVPRDTPNLGLTYTHEGGFPIGWFIITEGGWFQKPPVVRLN
jgi:hypothetical protein